MEQLTKTVILGIIQGLTEWLPISSTGHLKLAEQFLDLKAPILFDVILHIGTLIIILLFFRRDFNGMLSAFVHLNFKTEHGRLIPLIIVGTIPTALIGLVFGELIENTFQRILPIAIAFMVCGALLYSSKTGKEKTENINFLIAATIGVAQGIAIIPGISRSGATIAVALLLGVKREKAFKFSFLLSIPAILGALGLTIYKQFDVLTAAGLGWIDIFSGMAAAMIIGYLSLNLLWKILAKKQLHFFSFYCWILGAVLIAFCLDVF